MTTHRLRAAGLVLAGATLLGCAGEPQSPTGRVAIDVAPLSLAGITDATYVLTVYNAPGGAAGGGEVVWARTLTSQRYGDGAGSLSYVGPCDAATGANSVTLELTELRDASGVVPTTTYMNPTPVTRSATCVANGDVSVTFDITMARQAQQGFFDVAVQFQDIFCSAKLDCEDDDGSDLELLHDSSGARDMTVVLGFACTGSTTGTTYLYMDDLVITCSGLASDVRVAPTGLGTVTLEAADNPNGYLFAGAVYRGVEGFAGKAYWNVSLGLDASRFESSGVCVLKTRATASAEAFPQEADGFPLPAGSVYPVIDWEVPLSDDVGVDGRRVCTQHEVNGADGMVATNYLGYLPLQNGFTWSDGPVYMRHRFQPVHPSGPNGQVLSAGAPVCNPGCANGVCTADGAETRCDCTGTGYEGAVCDVPLCSAACVNGTCAAPDTCACANGFWGATCASACTLCDAEEFEQSPCSDGADRVCADCDDIAHCVAGAASCTGPDDESCADCEDGYFGPNCTACAAPCAAEEYELVACTDTTDRVCTDCTDITGCAVAETCTTAGDSVCATCVDGYTQLTAGAACTDVDECTVGGNDCSANATCSNTVGSFTCACKPGFFGDGVSCTACPAGQVQPNPGQSSCVACPAGQYDDGDEVCSTCASACTANAYEQTACTSATDRVCTSCTDITGCAVAETCTTDADSVCATCVDGYTQLTAGAACTDVDECTAGGNDCSANATCSNTVGSFTCACKPGFFGDGVTCTACPAGQVQPNPGQSSCVACPAGQYDDGDEVCATCASACTANAYEQTACTSATNRVCTACTDITGCAVAETCTTDADSVCATCVDGYTQLSAGAACADVDECTAGGNDCSANATCSNTVGSFTCACKPGFFGDGVNCTACPPGQVQPDGGQASCDACPAGQVQPDAGQLSCVACPAGQYDDGDEVCAPCAQGECIGAVTCDPSDGGSRVCAACDNGYTGAGCEAPPETCSDLVGSGLPDGVYTIDPDGAGGAAAFDVYCDADRGWTLIESFAYGNRAAMIAADFAQDLPLDEGSPTNTALHRLSLAHIQAIEARSTEWMATCNLDTAERRDFVRVALDELNLTTFSGTPGCPTAEVADIRGASCVACLVPWWQNGSTHLHLDSSAQHCGGEPWTAGAVGSEDNFGYYNSPNTGFSCSASDASTTNFWLRNRPCALGHTECDAGVVMACNDSGTALEAVEDCAAGGGACVAGACVDTPATCGELVGQGLPSGVYTIDPDGDGGLAPFDAYCDLVHGWTLIESFSLANKATVANKSFAQDLPLNEATPQSLAQHRLSLARIQALEAASSEWLAACNLDTSEGTDFIRATLSALPLSTYNASAGCREVIAADIRDTGGCSGCQVPFWQSPNVHHIHTDSSHTTCGARPWNTGAAASEDDFGFYSVVNSAFPCTATSASTTQWWLRGERCTPNAEGCSDRVATLCNSLGTVVEPVEDCGLSGQVCVAGRCRAARSCLELLELGQTADGYYWIDPTGSDPTWVYCNQTTDGGGWTRVASEDFNSGTPTGWTFNGVSLTTLTTCGSYGQILGGYNVLANGYALKTYTWPPIPHTQARLGISYIKIDSWDGESGYVNFTEGADDPATGTYWTQAFGNTVNQICGSANSGWTEASVRVALTIPHTSTAANVRASSTVNQAADDESWGLDDVVIWIR